MLKRLTRYLVFPEFTGPTINALNGMLSKFIFFLIDLIDWHFAPGAAWAVKWPMTQRAPQSKPFEPDRGVVVTTSKRCCLIFNRYFLIIICTQSYLFYRLKEDLMPMCSDYIHIPHLSIPTEFCFRFPQTPCS